MADVGSIDDRDVCVVKPQCNDHIHIPCDPPQVLRVKVLDKPKGIGRRLTFLNVQPLDGFSPACEVMLKEGFIPDALCDELRRNVRRGDVIVVTVGFLQPGGAKDGSALLIATGACIEQMTVVDNTGITKFVTSDATTSTEQCNAVNNVTTNNNVVNCTQPLTSCGEPQTRKISCFDNHCTDVAAHSNDVTTTTHSTEGTTTTTTSKADSMTGKMATNNDKDVRNNTDNANGSRSSNSRTNNCNNSNTNNENDDHNSNTQHLCSDNSDNNDTTLKRKAVTPTPEESEQRSKLLRKSCPERVKIFGEWLLGTYSNTCNNNNNNNNNGRVLDIAGGKGELALFLACGGLESILVDPRCASLKKTQRKQLRKMGKTLQVERNEFGVDSPESREMTSRLASTASLMVGMHPDQATGAIVVTAVAHRKPFAVVPCCVFSRLFPDRKLNGDTVLTHSHLCLWILGQHASVRATKLPFDGQNLVLYIRQYGDGPDEETISIRDELISHGNATVSKPTHNH